MYNKMPRERVAVPTLQVSLLDSSKTAAEVAKRHADSQSKNHQVAVSEKKASFKSQGKQMLRKSNGRRFQKKHRLKLSTSEKEVTSPLKQKSHIPKALVLPASLSTTRLATEDSLASTSPSPSGTTITKENQLESNKSNTSSFVRQKSALILDFRQRKSISQMDFSYSRCQKNFSIPSPPLSQRDNSENKQALIPTNCEENMKLTYSKNSFVHKMYNQDYYLAMPECDPQTAGMKVFATIMLNAWRKRRDEVRRLIEEVAALKRGAIKAKNQLHVFNRLFRAEQKRNEELNCQLKISLEDIKITKSSCESLTTSLISLKADKALLEQQLQMKEQEFDGTETLLTQTKSELFKSMTVQRELQASLSMEQRNIQTLENQKNELINEICELNNDALQKEEHLRIKLQEKCDELYELKRRLNDTEQKIKEQNENTAQQLRECMNREEHMRQELAAVENELNITRKCLQDTIGHRVKNYWNNSANYQKITFKTLHWLAYYVLPAMPPPTMKTLPFQLSFDKAMSIVKR